MEAISLKEKEAKTVDKEPQNTPKQADLESVKKEQTPIKQETRKFVSIDLETKKEPAKEVKQPKETIKSRPVMKKEEKKEYEFTPVISPIFGAKEENAKAKTSTKTPNADSEKHGMLYYVSRSVYDEESETWSEPSKYEEITIGFASSLPEYAVTESTPGKYKKQ